MRWIKTKEILNEFYSFIFLIKLFKYRLKKDYLRTRNKITKSNYSRL